MSKITSLLISLQPPELLKTCAVCTSLAEIIQALAYFIVGRDMNEVLERLGSETGGSRNEKLATIRLLVGLRIDLA